MNTEENKKNQNKKRWLISIFSTLLLVISVVISVFLGLNLDGKKTSSQFSNSAKVVLNIKKEVDSNLDEKQPLSNSQAYKTTQNYLQNGKVFSDVNLSFGNDAIALNISDTNETKTNEIINDLVKKSYLVITDGNGRPLFYKNHYFLAGSNENATLEKLLNGNEADYALPLENTPANWNTGQASNRVTLKLSELGNKEWNDLKEDYKNQQIYFWLNIQDFVNTAKTQYSEEWNAANQNPVNFAYVGNSRTPTLIEKPSQTNPTGKYAQPVLKKYGLNASKYLVTVASPSWYQNAKFGERKIYLFNDFNYYSNKELSSKVNFAYSPFKLELAGSYYVFGNKNNLTIFAIVFAVLFLIIGLYLIINYRIIGAIAFISLISVLIITFSIAINLGSIISPLMMFSLLMILFSTFVIINNSLSKFKNEIINKMNPAKAMVKAQKSSIFSSLDILFSFVVIAIIGLYASVLSVPTLASLIFLASVVAAIFAVGINDLIIYNLGSIEQFAIKPWMLSITKQPQIKWFNLNPKAKVTIFWTIITLIIIAFIAVLFKNGLNFNKSLNISSDLQNSFNYFIANDFSLAKAQEVANNLALKYPDVLISIHAQDINQYQYLVKISSSQTLDIQSFGFDNVKEFIWQKAGFAKLFGYSFIAIFVALILVAFYTLIRSGIISTLLLFVKVILSLTFVTIFMVLFQQQMDENILYIFFVTLVFATQGHLNDAMRIKELTHHDTALKNFILHEHELSLVTKQVFKEKVRSQSFALIIFLIALLVVSLKTQININLFIGLIIILGVNFFLDIKIMQILWNVLLIKKYQNKEKRIKNHYWSTSKVEEQEFVSINDFDK
ncbi:protein translocase subunit SecDF [[Mycoplasma] gypis]|uniref:Bifunctional preprotein translocase subunit SecD/SecF n=1 Tax=[Mycoplasma] gypis TaxID=92404 RepID=A0ABZ2RQJ2_9BACT|nr:hypothetical protein [[Mycoplasma] gypis]MBN0919305.1 hypothetical protein [[Mycoplasma] gypis]